MYTKKKSKMCIKKHVNRRIVKTVDEEFIEVITPHHASQIRAWKYAGAETGFSKRVKIFGGHGYRYKYWSAYRFRIIRENNDNGEEQETLLVFYDHLKGRDLYNNSRKLIENKSSITAHKINPQPERPRPTADDEQGSEGQGNEGQGNEGQGNEGQGNEGQGGGQ